MGGWVTCFAPPEEQKHIRFLWHDLNRETGAGVRSSLAYKQSEGDIVRPSELDALAEYLGLRSGSVPTRYRHISLGVYKRQFPTVINVLFVLIAGFELNQGVTAVF